MASSNLNVIFGRFNPPTIGHERLLRHALSTAQARNADVVVFVSGTQDQKTNPLTYEEKCDVIRKTIPRIIIGPAEARTPLTALAWALQEGYQDITVLVGSDRLVAFTELLKKWQQHADPDNTIVVRAAALPREGAMSSEKVSGTTARRLAQQGNLAEFSRILMGGERNPQLAKELMAKIQRRLGQVHESNTQIDIDRLIEMLLVDDITVNHDSITSFDNPGARPADDDDTRVPEDDEDNKSVLILYPERKLKYSMLDKLLRKRQDHEREQEQARKRRLNNK